MLRPVEVWHEGRWIPATLMATRRDAGGWHGLVGYTDPLTRVGYYHWCREEHLRSPEDMVPPTGAAT
jgi:hypothetical protein